MKESWLAEALYVKAPFQPIMKSAGRAGGKHGRQSKEKIRRAKFLNTNKD